MPNTLKPKALLNRLRTEKPSFGRNMLWMALTQGVHRIARLGATLIAARLLMPEAFGIAAIVLTVHELVNAITHSAFVPALVQARDDAFDMLCNHAHRLNWLLCILLMGLQCAIGYGVSLAYNDPILFPAIAVLSLSFLCLPPATIHAAKVLRENRLNVVARAEMGQSLGEAVLIIVFAVAGFGFWALVLPKLLTAPYWTYVYRRATSWTPTPPNHWRIPPALTRFSGPMIGNEVVFALRNHMDYLLIGFFLSLDVLGVYYFAFNAGLGLSLGLLRAYSTALFPHLCATSEAQKGDSMLRGMRLFARFAVPVILAQCLLAPWYVPILFGERWVELGALPILILICLSALPRIVLDTCSQGLRAAGVPGIDLKLQLLTTVLFGVGMMAGLPWGIQGVATGILIGTTLAALPAYALTHRRLAPTTPEVLSP
ncbi:oligosaccharide flippase family protein [Larsenimonas suaedae]|uniref:Oligosaccharide flippase family protein n=1 Tax=Larsenimonas suaedae TaxID=1851019 RepID=A0ABU1GWF0_9GAMM|nr:oligosaccharide flippase family protein [Larsenimonas suaedae]MCM2971168.1 oligosaccharide flippase family protein [Larsenimonas suaedae]MDR5895877.1 oligosaccharide flippase family protein [Larsenimonas suaedae]